MMTEDRTYAHPEKVVCVARPELAKAGAAYFESIVPFAIPNVPDQVIAERVPQAWRKSYLEVTEHIRRSFPARPGAKIRVRSGEESLVFTGEQENDEEVFAILLENSYAADMKDFRSRFLLGLSHAGFAKLPVLISSTSVPNSSATLDDITLTLVNLELIDFKNASWEQILELRKDRESQLRLRNLRLFLHKEYLGKDTAYIEDHLNKTIGDYANAVRDHGFTALTSTLSTLLSSKSLLATVGTTAAAIIFGMPVEAAAVASVGTVLELGKVAVEVAKKRHAFHLLKRDHPVAFIADVQERFGR